MTVARGRMHMQAQVPDRPVVHGSRGVRAARHAHTQGWCRGIVAGVGRAASLAQCKIGALSEAWAYLPASRRAGG